VLPLAREADAVDFSTTNEGLQSWVDLGIGVPRHSRVDVPRHSRVDDAGDIALEYEIQTATEVSL
jgi:hypothetical protein